MHGRLGQRIKILVNPQFKIKSWSPLNIEMCQHSNMTWQVATRGSGQRRAKDL